MATDKMLSENGIFVFSIQKRGEREHKSNSTEKDKKHINSWSTMIYSDYNIVRKIGFHGDHLEIIDGCCMSFTELFCSILKA